MAINETARCKYSKIEPNIHEFIFTESSRKAVDEFIAIMQDIAANPAEGEIIHNLMDSSVGVQPIAYIFRRTRSMMKQFQSQSQSQSSSKLALILPTGPLVQGVEMMLRSFPSLQTRIFKPGERDKAILWLNE